MKDGPQKAFKVVYMPFPMSDVTSEGVAYGVDEDDAREYYKKNFPMYRIKSVTEE